jgi:hypothetical protein
MCACTPEIRTPFCGRGECKWPEQSKQKTVWIAWWRDSLVTDIYAAAEGYATTADEAVHFPSWESCAKWCKLQADPLAWQPKEVEVAAEVQR